MTCIKTRTTCSAKLQQKDWIWCIHSHGHHAWLVHTIWAFAEAHHSINSLIAYGIVPFLNEIKMCHTVWNFHDRSYIVQLRLNEKLLYNRSFLSWKNKCVTYVSIKLLNSAAVSVPYLFLRLVSSTSWSSYQIFFAYYVSHNVFDGFFFLVSLYVPSQVIWKYMQVRSTDVASSHVPCHLCSCHSPEYETFKNEIHIILSLQPTY